MASPRPNPGFFSNNACGKQWGLTPVSLSSQPKYPLDLGEPSLQLAPGWSPNGFTWLVPDPQCPSHLETLSEYGTTMHQAPVRELRCTAPALPASAGIPQLHPQLPGPWLTLWLQSCEVTQNGAE